MRASDGSWNITTSSSALKILHKKTLASIVPLCDTAVYYNNKQMGWRKTKTSRHKQAWLQQVSTPRAVCFVWARRKA